MTEVLNFNVNSRKQKIKSEQKDNSKHICHEGSTHLGKSFQQRRISHLKRPKGPPTLGFHKAIQPSSNGMENYRPNMFKLRRVSYLRQKGSNGKEDESFMALFEI